MGLISRVSSRTYRIPPKTYKMSFSDFGFDERLLQKIAQNNWSHPTTIQKSMFNHIMNKRNIIAKAPTGSGKTAAYLLPLLDKNLKNQSNKVLILVPSHELIQQVYKSCKFLAPEEVHIRQLSDDISYSGLDGRQNGGLSPDVLISTPTKIMKYLNQIQKNSENFLQQVQTIVIDEADSITTYGHATALQNLINLNEIKSNKSNKNVQMITLSATLDMEDEEL